MNISNKDYNTWVSNEDYEKIIVNGSVYYDSACDQFIEVEIKSKFGDDIFEGLNLEEKKETIDASLKLMGKTRNQIIKENEPAIKEILTHLYMNTSTLWLRKKHRLITFTVGQYTR